VGLITPVSRAEERGLLDGWLTTVEFDHEPTGIPALAPEDDDEDPPAGPVTAAFEEAQNMHDDPPQGDTAHAPVTASGIGDLHLPDGHDQTLHGRRHPPGTQDDGGDMAPQEPAAVPDAAPPATPPPVHTGAMIALLPSPGDAARLAVDGGEPAGELHCTLMYLGEAAAIGPAVRASIVAAVRAYVDGWPPVVADGFAISLFNPPGMTQGDGRQRDTCVVLGLSGDDLDCVHDMVTEALDDLTATPLPAGEDPDQEPVLDLPDQHRPWHSHLTLAYDEDPKLVGALVDRCGPVTFDRVRVVFGGSAVDLPLNTPAPPIAATTAAAGTDFLSRMPAHLKAYWLRRIAPWGEGSFTRCVRLISPHYPTDPEGTCANLHKEATGRFPGANHTAQEQEEGAGMAAQLTVVQLLDELAAGRVTTETVAADFSARTWPAEDGVAGTLDESGPSVVPAVAGADTWAAVDADSRLSPEQYATLSWAYWQARGGTPPEVALDGATTTETETTETDMAKTATPTKEQTPAGPPQGDCPPAYHPDPDTGDCVPDPDGMPGKESAPPAAAAVAPAPDQPEHFHTWCLEGVSTGMRTFTPGAITWRNPPFAYHWQADSSAHGGQPRVVQVGLVTRVERDGDVVHFYGRLDLRSPDGLDYAHRLADGFAVWSSVGADEQPINAEFVYAEGVDPDSAEAMFAEPTQVIFHSYNVAEVSAVSTPALADAHVEPTPSLVDALAALQPVTAAAARSHTTPTAVGGWDGAAAEKRLPSPMPVATARDEYAWVDESKVTDGEVPKAAGKLPHHDVSADGKPGAANVDGCSAAIAAVHGARGGVSIPEAHRLGAYNHLRKHLVDSGRTPESIPKFEAGPIVAAGYTVVIPDLPPESWFQEPADMSPHGELRVDEHGRLWGWLAPAAVSHRSYPGRHVTVPMGNVDYSGWMNKAWPVAEGHKIYVGVITMDCGHASTTPGDRSYTHRREHYDNSCSVAAHARIGEVPGRGVWVAGAVAPWLDAEDFGRMMSCDLSGDWPPHADRPGWVDFTAALLVPAAGFPTRVPTATVRVREGALVSSAVPVRFAPTELTEGPSEDLRPALELIARTIGRDTGTRLAVMRDRIHSQDGG
jgi:hypothetical protein